MHWCWAFLCNVEWVRERQMGPGQSPDTQLELSLVTTDPPSITAAYSHTAAHPYIAHLLFWPVWLISTSCHAACILEYKTHLESLTGWLQLHFLAAVALHFHLETLPRTHGWAYWGSFNKSLKEVKLYEIKFGLAHKHLRLMVTLAWQRPALCLSEVVLLSWLLFPLLYWPFHVLA